MSLLITAFLLEQLLHRRYVHLSSLAFTRLNKRPCSPLFTNENTCHLLQEDPASSFKSSTPLSKWPSAEELGSRSLTTEKGGCLQRGLPPETTMGSGLSQVCLGYKLPQPGEPWWDGGFRGQEEALSQAAKQRMGDGDTANFRNFHLSALEEQKAPKNENMFKVIK